MAGGETASFFPDQTFVIALFLLFGDRMAGIWRAYQSLMSRYPWTMQIVTAGRKNNFTAHLSDLCPSPL